MSFRKYNSLVNMQRHRIKTFWFIGTPGESAPETARGSSKASTGLV